MGKQFTTLTSSIVLIAALTTSVPETIAQNIQSPEVHPDGRVTFRLRAPRAEAVSVSLNGNRLEMASGDNSLWIATSEVLDPGIHDYTFDVDGTRMIDPSNRRVKKWFTLASMVEVPGDPPRLTEFQDVPHGTVHRLYYHSESVGHQRPLLVYTPPGVESRARADYPLVVLMHGFGDDETAWTEVGCAHLIADNLLARGEILPVIIAMPYGHPIPVAAGTRPENYFERNNELYESDIVEDLLPFLKSRFPVTDDPQQRSIVGLSMGGGHALHVGLRHTDLFSSIGAFSAATPQGDQDKLLERYPSLQGPEPAANQLRHLFIPIGESDFLLSRNDTFVERLQKFGVQHTYQKTKGGHEWKVWRRYLPEFLRMVAPSAKSSPDR